MKRWKATVTTRPVGGDTEHGRRRQRAVQVREQHGLRIRWYSWFPPYGRVQCLGVDVEQDQVVATGEKPVGGQVHLLRCRQMYESDLGQRRGAKFADDPGGVPVVLSAQVE